MKRLWIVLIVVGVLLAVLLAVGWWLDRTARQMAEVEASKRIVEVLPHTRKATVEIEGFPFLADVLLFQRVDRLHVTLDEIADAGVGVEHVDLVVDEIRIDRDLLLREQKLAVTGIDRAEVVARVTGEAISRVLGETVRFDGEEVHVTVQGMHLDAKLEVAGRRVSLNLSSKDVPPELARRYLRPMVFTLPGEDVLPCTPGVAVKQSRLELRCSVNELPVSVRRALGQR
ncbi:MAG: DUF2993 domain-containing protein [Nannocystaceae bacterium]|nr:DUF2993 domain-containing protein [Nannocystaceae bacterium]